VLVAVASSIPAEATGPKPPPGVATVTVQGRVAWVSSVVHRPDKPTCRSSNQAIGFYRQAYRASRHAMGQEGLPVRRWWGCNSARRRAVEWRAKAHQARVELTAWVKYQYDWRSWLPRNWYLVGSCESGYGGDPNWEHTNHRFTSAFGISWREYDADAAYMGAPPWHVRHTPRDQYKAALGHYARFGDGWDCPGP
jgi:hypothetical protein